MAEWFELGESSDNEGFINFSMGKSDGVRLQLRSTLGV